MEALGALSAKNEKFRFYVEGVGRKISSTEQREIVDKFEQLNKLDRTLIDLQDFQ